MSDYGDEIREYIQQLACASAAHYATDTAANVQTTTKLTTMEAEIKKLTATIASMANKLNSNPNPNPNGENINPTAEKSKAARTGTHIRNSGTWEGTAAHTGFIQLESSTTAQPASTRNPSTRVKPHGATDSAATWLGPAPNASQWNNRSTPRGKDKS